MSRAELVELTNMCLIYDGDKVLVQDRKDPKWPGLCFPGGHVQVGESLVASTIREVYEETGLVVSDLELCGIKQFPHQKGHRYMVFLYKTNHFTGQLKSSPEGEVFWLEKEELLKQKLPTGFAEMLTIFEEEQLSENFWYEEDGQWQTTNY